MGSIFGGSKQKQTSGNKAFEAINTAFSPLFGQATEGANAFQALLGGDTSGFDAYKKATGFDATAEAGSRGITGNAAAGGLLRSGGTAKSLQAYGTNLQNQFAGDYLDRQLARANLGFNAGQLVTQAGQYSKSKSKSKNGIGGVLGGVGSIMAASDRRLKKNIFKVGEMDNGLGIYQYRYINNYGPVVGVMADEVERLMPEALGPEIAGYKTVNYEKVMEARDGS